MLRLRSLRRATAALASSLEESPSLRVSMYPIISRAPGSGGDAVRNIAASTGRPVPRRTTPEPAARSARASRSASSIAVSRVKSPTSGAEATVPPTAPVSAWWNTASRSPICSRSSEKANHRPVATGPLPRARITPGTIGSILEKTGAGWTTSLEVPHLGFPPRATLQDEERYGFPRPISHAMRSHQLGRPTGAGASPRPILSLSVVSGVVLSTREATAGGANSPPCRVWTLTAARRPALLHRGLDGERARFKRSSRCGARALLIGDGPRTRTGLARRAPLAPSLGTLTDCRTHAEPVPSKRCESLRSERAGCRSAEC